MADQVDIWADRRVKIGYETAEELAKKLNPANFRGHPESQADALDDSLDLLGWVGSVKLNINTNRIFDGELRIKRTLVKDPKLPIPVDYYDLSPDEELLALQVHDAITEQAEPIADKLAALLERTRALTADRPGLGAMLQALKLKAGINGNGQGDNGDEPPMPTETEAERLAKQWETAPGQVWQLGRHIIACLDSTDEAAVRELIGGKAVGMVWADPPYGMEAVDRNSRMKELGWRQYANDGNIQTAVKSFSNCSKFNCKMIYWGANHYANALPNSPGWIVWDKQDGKDSLTYSMCELAWHNAGSNVQVFKHIWDGFRKDSERNNSRLHPSQKPSALPEWYFSNYGKPETIIFDPFLGSGISVLAAEKINDGRRVIGCELAHEYIAVTIHRWQQMTGQTPRRVSG